MKNGSNKFRLVFALIIALFILNSCSPDLYVSNMGDGTITIVDRNDRSVIGTIELGGLPTHIGVLNSINRAYVCDLDSNNIHVIDTSNDSYSDSILIQRPVASLDIDPDKKLIYALDYGGTNLQVIDPITKTQIADEPIGINVQDIRLDSATSQIYVTDFIEGLIVIDAGNYTKIKTIPIAGGAHGLSIDPNSGFVYVTRVEDDSVSVIDSSAGLIIAEISVGDQPEWVATNKAGTKAYVTNAGDGAVSVIDMNNKKVADTIPVGAGSFYIVIDHKSEVAYVTNTDANTVSVIDTKTDMAIDTIIAELEPVGLAIIN